MADQPLLRRTLLIGLLAGLVAGLITGVSGRIVMRIVALTAHAPVVFSVGGTLNIMWIVLLIGAVAGVAFRLLVLALSASPKTTKYLPSYVWRGVAFGTILLLIAGVPSVVISLLPKKFLNPGDFNLGIPLLTKSMFATLPVIYGLVLGLSEKFFDQHLLVVRDVLR